MLAPRRTRLRQRLRRYILACSVFSAACLLPQLLNGANAADWFVTSSADSGVGTLRQAMLDAGSGDRILISPSLSGGDTIYLLSELPTINQDLTIDSSDNASAEIHGLELFRVFFVESGNVEIKGLTITQGKATGGNGAGLDDGLGSTQGTGGGGGGLGAGGALFVDNGATVTLSQVTIQESAAEGGNGGTFDPTSALGGGGGGGGLGGDGGLGGGGIDGGVDSKGGGGGGGGLVGDGGSSIFYGGGGGGGLEGEGGVGDGPPVLRDGLGTNSGGGGSFSTDGGTGTGSAGAGGDGVVDGAGGGGGGGDGGQDGTDGTSLDGGDGGDGGFGGGGGGTGADSLGGFAGNGGEFGGGGGAGEGAFAAGDGGFGGGGGGASGTAGAFGGLGGFGGGGGAASGANAGLGGEYGGDGGNTGGGGGGALGGAIFVHQGGNLILNDTSISNSTLTAGAGAGDGTTGSVEGESIFLNDNDLAVNVTADTSMTISQSISDSSTFGGSPSELHKNGAGTLTLSGDNTYAGETRVDDGLLAINGSVAGDVQVLGTGELGGDGIIGGGVLSTGRLAAGNSIGTMTTIGNLVASGSIEVEVAAGGNTPGVHNDLYDVGGQADLSGATVEVVGTAGNFVDGTQYTFLTTGSGIIGALPGITDNLYFFDATLDSVSAPGSLIAQLDSNGLSLVAAAQTQNQQAMAEYLEYVNAAPTSDFLDVMDALFAAGPSHTRQGLAEIGGQIYPTMAIVQLQQTSHSISMLRGQLAAEIPCHSQDALIGWVRGYAMGGDASGNVHSGASGFDFDVTGTEIAFQNCVADNAAIGCFVNLASSDIELSDVNQNAQIDTRLFGGSLQLFGSTFYGLAVAGVGLQDYEVQRGFTFTDPDRSTRTDFDGTQAFVYLEQGMRIETERGLLQPFVGLQGIHLHHERFLEEGDDSFSLDLRGGLLNTDSFRSVLGFGFESPLNARSLSMQLQAAWMHEFLDTHQDFSSHSYWQELFFDETTKVETKGNDLGRDWAVLGVGLKLQLRPRIGLLANYQNQINDVQSFHTGSGGVQIQW